MVGAFTVCYLFPRQRDVRANDQLIDNGNRIEWSPIRSVIIRVINKIGWQRGGSPICRSRVWLQTELGDTNSCYQLKITASISGKKRLTLRTNISGRDNVRSKKIYLFWKFLSFSMVVAMIIVINSAIGGFGWVDLLWLAASTVRLQVSDYSQLPDYNCPKW